MIKAAVVGHGKVGKETSFAVKIVDSVGNVHERIVPLISKSVYFAELNAIKYVMLAIQDRKVDLYIETNLPHIPTYFDRENGKWVNRVKSNTKLIKELRELSQDFNTFKIEHLEDKSELLDEVHGMVKNVDPFRS